MTRFLHYFTSLTAYLRKLLKRSNFLPEHIICYSPVSVTSQYWIKMAELIKLIFGTKVTHGLFCIVLQGNSGICNTSTHTHTRTHACTHMQPFYDCLDFVQDNPGEQVPLSASSIYYDPWHPPCSIYVPDSLFPQSLSKCSRPGTPHFILHTFLQPIIAFFLQHMPIPLQPVLL